MGAGGAKSEFETRAYLGDEEGGEMVGEGGGDVRKS